ncbi:PIG-L family deacetylase [Candidatus Woesearchaeota archaeon]|nr:PIG-L family deacetylase [Candidatus Woesearchaeota archaeon]
MVNELILVFVAHSDDEVIGMGGTILKYIQEKKDIVTVLVSNGEKSSPWLKKDLLVKERIKETEDIEKFLGIKKTLFLDYKDTKLKEELDTPEAEKKIEAIIKEFKPKKIFTHSSFDAHLDHRAVNKIVMKVLDKIDKKNRINLYSFEIWNVIEETNPRIYVDISSTFKKKLQAIKKFKSQKIYTYILLIPTIYKAFILGMLNKCRFAERFYRLR